jgi:hypothetical protein
MTQKVSSRDSWKRDLDAEDVEDSKDQEAITPKQHPISNTAPNKGKHEKKEVKNNAPKESQSDKPIDDKKKKPRTKTYDKHHQKDKANRKFAAFNNF